MEKANKPSWYTIKGAAEYLQVGEPTIYRWMKENKITFRKVGDSTRFLQEDLDAVIVIHPSKEKVEKVKERCPFCNHEELISGKGQSTGHIYFVPTKTKFWTFSTGTIKTESKMCRRCGGISFFGDTEHLEKLIVDENKEEAKK